MRDLTRSHYIARATEHDTVLTAGVEAWLDELNKQGGTAFNAQNKACNETKSGSEYA